jgi:hypothetical protein
MVDAVRLARPYRALAEMRQEKGLTSCFDKSGFSCCNGTSRVPGAFLVIARIPLAESGEGGGRKLEEAAIESQTVHEAVTGSKRIEAGIIELLWIDIAYRPTSLRHQHRS